MAKYNYSREENGVTCGNTPHPLSIHVRQGLLMVGMVVSTTVNLQAVTYQPSITETYNYTNPLERIDTSDELEDSLSKQAEVKLLMKSKLAELKNLKKGWDGYGAFPIEESSYKNTLSAINLIPASKLSKWNLFPSTNGTLLFSTKDKQVASISIGNDSFSYIAIPKNGKPMEGEATFTKENFVSMMDEIHHVLGY